MKNIYMAQKKAFVKTPVVLNGIGRSGKFFVAKILSSFEKMEYFQYISIIDHIPYILRMNRISKDAAASMLRVNIDEYAYNMATGRYLNTRYNDLSSIRNSHEADAYFKRSQSEVNEKLIADMKKGRRKPIFVIHEGLPNIGIFLKVFPLLRWVNLIRHPVDVIHSWYLRGWGHRFMSDPLSLIPLIKGVNSALPWYTHNWRREYETSSEMDRIIKSIYVVTMMGKKAYKKLSAAEKKRVMFICFEGMVTQPDKVTKKIGRFLNSKPVNGFSKILKQERCPRILDPLERQKKYNDIKVKSTQKMHKLLDELIDDYQNNKFHGYPL